MNLQRPSRRLYARPLIRSGEVLHKERRVRAGLADRILSIRDAQPSPIGCRHDVYVVPRVFGVGAIFPIAVNAVSLLYHKLTFCGRPCRRQSSVIDILRIRK